MFSLTFNCLLMNTLLFIESINGYIDGAVDVWKNLNNTECLLGQQSPINIPLSQLQDCSINKTFPEKLYLELKPNNTKFKNLFIVENNGYGLDALPVTITKDNPYGIEVIEFLHQRENSIQTFYNPKSFTYKGNVHPEYCFSSLHLHWGKNNSFGSEHIFDGKPSAMELHMVHYSCDFSDITDATSDYLSKNNTKEDKRVLAVIGVLFDVGEANPALDTLLSPDIISQDEYYFDEPNVINYPVAEFNLTDLIPGYINGNDTEKEYVLYMGSLTTPPCYEDVKWFVMKKRLTISQEQLNQLRRLKGAYNQSLSDNWRFTEPINNRTLYNCQYQIEAERYYGNNEINTSNLTTTVWAPNVGPSQTVSVVLSIILLVIIIIISIIFCWYCKDEKKSNENETVYTQSSIERPLKHQEDGTQKFVTNTTLQESEAETETV